MQIPKRMFRVCSHCIWVGVGLMSLALFLHPMSPENFLALAFSSPLESMRHAYGMQVMALFSISVMVLATGLIGLLCSITFNRKSARLATESHDINNRSSVDNMEENWSFL